MVKIPIRKFEKEGKKKERQWGDEQPRMPGDKPPDEGDSWGAFNFELVKGDSAQAEMWKKTYKHGEIKLVQGSYAYELLKGEGDLAAGRAKLTLVEAKAQGSLAHGEIDIVGALLSLFCDDGPEILPMPIPALILPMAARVGDPTAHGAPLGPGPGSATVLIGGKPAWLVGPSLHLCPLANGPTPHGVGPSAVGAANVLINGVPAARAGDWATEPCGGPDVIVSGCATVFIGLPAALPPVFVPPPRTPAELPWILIDLKGSGDIAYVEGEAVAKVGADVLDGRGGLQLGGGAGGGLARGQLDGGVRIQVPFTTMYVGLGFGLEAAALTLAAEAHAGISVREGKKLFAAGAGAKAGAGLLGGGFSLSFEVTDES